MNTSKGRSPGRFTVDSHNIKQLIKSLNSLVEFGKHSGDTSKKSSYIYHQAKHNLVELIKIEVARDFPKLVAHLNTIGYENLSIKMIENYKGVA